MALKSPKDYQVDPERNITQQISELYRHLREDLLALSLLEGHDISLLVHRDGSTPLTAGWDVGNNNITGINSLGVDGLATFSGGMLLKYTETSASVYNVLGADYKIYASGGDNVCAVTLPVAPVDKQVFNVKAVDITNAVSIDPNGKNIDGSGSDLVLALNQTYILQYITTLGWMLW